MPQQADQSYALISVFYKDGLDKLVKSLSQRGYRLLSTGGTRAFIEELGYPVEAVEDLTGYPSILGGRVKTLHPKVFGGILGRRDLKHDQEEMQEYEIPSIDVIVVDLYPFEETLASGADHDSIIEKIDIGGISLIRAAAKNYKDTWIIPSRNDYQNAISILEKGTPSQEERRQFAARAFAISSAYDRAIENYLVGDHSFNLNFGPEKVLRYGENPHQKGAFFGHLEEVFEQLHGKELSYNNLLDADAAVSLIKEFDETTLAILKHNNACGVASRENLTQAWKDALAGDPVSAFGGIIITNVEVDGATAEEMNSLFFEIVIAPSYSKEALTILQQKKNRIILILKDFEAPAQQFRSLLNGALVQDRDFVTDRIEDMETRTQRAPSAEELSDLAFASKICKNTKSNTIVLAKGKQLVSSGTGQTSRVDALKQAIVKAKSFNFDLNGAVMASDAFFPFPDCVEIAHKEGINTVIQPGGSVKDQLSIDYCNDNNMAMVFTGTRHFKH
ncbi:MAG: bifunctional phosphoribosylaminoimidazolecarboxamide formyltransferase/IMP cyclohydrolase PurH [Owenweeksia sp.]|nr:bifunctional phosphoribosylaminoimidazolecarboxamide formyltransferase/IMP cyclohydrolase PurH [Owenweeksia sp.]MBG00588.1 bifunctional phosphoribosylaminoimidazolecarboxamide formyltransferase/IMP cyclohydrolase PurH [Owenweeksia sp.]HBF21725.1 bifunctional phosphoribosylaminoimidazolecarboxamide formyltransferase/IMP cyclohydrolase PurH [Cryomorphaceae bacterium]HCQ15263.1 bifunctional phosphoribosylaminoimidazolecarboxamide formyltransferase/IMP cyclohydrolase PurH [Cryomorphaceae bacteriu|tara:strand:- start:24427 stop:25938 length:1512 start_codon:yes stop_codon:yes gene_type:complete